VYVLSLGFDFGIVLARVKDPFGAALRLLDFTAQSVAAVARCFVSWGAALTEAGAGVIAIDGKTASTLPEKERQGPHPHSFGLCGTQRLILGQVKRLSVLVCERGICHQGRLV
jgi:hypothetical protein